jgi:L-iditol 2-dehydrogenase
VAPCGTCYFCRSGQEASCFHGTQYSGAFAEYGVYGEGPVFPISDEVGFEVGTMLEPLSIAIRTNELGRVGPDKSVAILGAGPIGMLTLIVATHSGATKILVSEPVTYKREFAERLGATIAVDPSHQDLPEIAKEVTNGLASIRWSIARASSPVRNRP